MTKDHVDAPVILAEKKKKEGAMSRAKKNIASKTATSALGKKVPFISPQLVVLLCQG